MVKNCLILLILILLASIMYCNPFGGTATCFAKITRCSFWTPDYNTTFFADRPVSLYHK